MRFLVDLIERQLTGAKVDEEFALGIVAYGDRVLGAGVAADPKLVEKLVRLANVQLAKR